MWLPEIGEGPWLLVAGWRVPGSDRPLVLLASPAARRAGRTGKWYARAYHRRWGAEDVTRGIKQRFHLESFLVRAWRAIRRLLWLVAWAFRWLNLWGGGPFDRPREAVVNRPWRLRKSVTDLFDWIAALLHELLHPHPKLAEHTE